MLTTVAFVRHLLHLLSPQIWPPNVELTFYQVHCSCQKSLLPCCCVRRTDFMAKYTMIIFSCCCIVNHSFGSILVLKESHRPAEKHGKKIVKYNFGMENKIGCFFGPRYMLMKQSKTMNKDKKR